MRCVLGPFLTCHLPHHRSDYFLSDTSETKEKNKSVQFTPHSDNECGHSAASRLQDRCGAYWDRSSPATCPHHRSDYFLSDTSETKEKNKSVQFKCTAINEREHGAASKLRDGEGSCGAYWYRSSPATCHHHRSDSFLYEASETKENNTSVQFKLAARTNSGTAQLRGFESGEG